MNTATYNPRDWIATFGAIPLMDGVADGDFLEVEYDEDLTTVVTGAGGDSVLVLNLNQVATATVRVLQASPVNDALSILAGAWQGGTGTPLPFFVKTKNGATTAVSASAAIKKIPKITGAKDAPTNEWTFVLTKAKFFQGGAAR